MKFFDKFFLKSEKLHFPVIAFVSFAVMLPVLIYGVPYGYDLPHHYQCALTFQESILSGDFYPSWSLHRNFGYGGMETRLYPPVSHYSLALFSILVGNWHLASWLAFLFFTCLGGWGAYLWAKEYMPASQAVFAGSIYILLPYHLNQLYNTFFFAEYAGSAVLPFAFVFTARVCRRGRAADIAGLSVAFAALVLTHLPLTVIGSISLAFYALSRFERDKLFSQILKLSAGVSAGLAASAFFWIKVFEEKNLMAKTLVYPDPWLDYRLHFLLSPVQTFAGELRTRIFETSTLYYDLMFFCAVFLALACTLPFIFSKRKTVLLRLREKNMRGVWTVFALAVFLAIPASRFVWDNFPILQEVQFPWRWLAVSSLAAAILSASKLDRLALWFKTEKRPLALIVTGCILAVITFSLSQIVRQAPHIPSENFERSVENIRHKEGFSFWWTIWTRKQFSETKEKVSAGERSVRIKKWTATEKEFTVGASSSKKTVHVAVFYHPNWRAEISGEPVSVSAAADGAVNLRVPPANSASDVSLKFTENRFQIAFQMLAPFIWLMLFAVLFFSERIFRSERKFDL